MTKVSKQTASKKADHGPVCDHAGDLHDFTVNFVDFRQDIDATPLLKGLPNDMCQCPHWGYIVRGKMTVRFADRTESYQEGDAFYLPPGHVPIAHQPGTELVQFSPAGKLRETEEVLVANIKAMQGG